MTAGWTGPSAGLSGRIVYGPDTDHDFWVIQLPNGRPQKITAFGALDFASSPAWSPDRNQIAYSFYQLPGTGGIPLPPGTDVYVMNADGSPQRLVAAHDVPGAVLQTPLWSAGATSLYVSYQAQRPDGGLDIGIDRLDVATGARTRVVPNAIAPAVSRDGKLLAYALLPTPSVRSFTLWRSAADSSAPLQLIGPNVFVRYQGLRFSPDRQRLLFTAVGNGQGYTPPSGVMPGSPFDLLFEAPVAYADGDLWDLWTIDVDGRNLHRVTAINEALPVSAWSPDGTHIAFLGGRSTVTAQGAVSVTDVSGSAILRLTVQPGHRGLDRTVQRAPRSLAGPGEWRMGRHWSRVAQDRDTAGIASRARFTPMIDTINRRARHGVGLGVQGVVVPPSGVRQELIDPEDECRAVIPGGRLARSRCVRRWDQRDARSAVRGLSYPRAARKVVALAIHLIWRFRQEQVQTYSQTSLRFPV